MESTGKHKTRPVHRYQYNEPGRLPLQNLELRQLAEVTSRVYGNVDTAVETVLDRQIAVSLRTFYMRHSHDSSDIATLVTQAQNGDSDAMSHLYDRFAPDIFRFAFTIVKSRDVAEDVVSESFFRAWTHLPSFKGGNFRAYLYTIARHYAYDLLKKDARCVELLEHHEALVADNDVIDNALSHERKELIAQALNKLCDCDRDVLVLRYFEELSVKETADILGRSEIWVRVNQHRALKKLEKIL